MGCMNVINNLKCGELYFEDSSNGEEHNIREWEQRMGFFRNNFASVYSLLITDEKNLIDNSTFQAAVTRNFSEKFLSVILNDPYFKTADGYDSQKVMNLLFLSTIHIKTSTVGKQVFCDKASYLFGQINRDYEKGTNEPIERYNTHLTELLSSYYDISCVVLPEIYLKTEDNKIEKEKSYAKFKDEKCKEGILKCVKDQLFKTVKGEDMNTISFDELTSKLFKSANVSLFYIF
jgi:hypothetical protein